MNTLAGGLLDSISLLLEVKMHAIEFEATSYQNTIRLPESVPDGVRLRVLLLSQTPLAKSGGGNLKTLLASVAEGLSEVDLPRPNDMGREAMEWAS